MPKGFHGRRERVAERRSRPLSMRTTDRIRDRLEAAAQASGRTLCAEAEFRLEMSFIEDNLRAAVREELRSELRAELRSEIRLAIAKVLFEDGEDDGDAARH